MAKKVKVDRKVYEIFKWNGVNKQMKQNVYAIDTMCEEYIRASYSGCIEGTRRKLKPIYINGFNDLPEDYHTFSEGADWYLAELDITITCYVTGRSDDIYVLFCRCFSKKKKKKS